MPADNLGTGGRVVFVTHLILPGSFPWRNVQNSVYRGVWNVIVGAGALDGPPKIATQFSVFPQENNRLSPYGDVHLPVKCTGASRAPPPTCKGQLPDKRKVVEGFEERSEKLFGKTAKIHRFLLIFFSG